MGIRSWKSGWVTPTNLTKRQEELLREFSEAGRGKKPRHKTQKHKAKHSEEHHHDKKQSWMEKAAEKVKEALP